MNKWYRFSVAILLALSIIFGYIIYLASKEGLLQIYFLDVGQGDAIYVRSPGGNDMLVDGGPNAMVLRELSKFMPFYDRYIDVIIATHPDADHIGGLPAVLERYGVGVFVEPGVSSDNVIDDEISRIKKSMNIDTILARRGMSIDLGGGAMFEILFPAGDVSFLETNTASIVGVMRYGSTSVMLTGDSPRSVEDSIVKIYGDSIKSDILKAGHHGSRTSSSENFVRTVSPRYVIISAGANNRYGHPHKEVVDIFDKLGILVFRTSDMGTVSCKSDGHIFSCK